MPDDENDDQDDDAGGGLFSDIGEGLQDALYTELIEHYKQQLEQLKKDTESDNMADIAKLNISLAETYATIGEWNEAVYHFTQAELFEENLTDWKERVNLYEKMGEIFTQQNKWNKAIRSFRSAREIAESNNDDSDDWRLKMSEIYHGMGRVYWRKGTYKKAMHFLERSISTHGGKNVTTSSTYVELGNLMTELGKPDKAAENYQQALEILEEIGDQYHKTRIFNNLSDLYLKNEEWDTALDYVTKCIESAKATQNKVLLGYGYNNGAEVYARTDQSKEAEEYAALAEEIFLELDAIYPMANVHFVRGIIATVEGEWDRGTEKFEEAIRLYEEADIPFYHALALYEMSILLHKKGDDEMAAEKVQEALNIWQELGADAMAQVAEKFLAELVVKKK